MILIKINRSTIRKNPEGGRQYYSIPMERSITSSFSMRLGVDLTEEVAKAIHKSQNAVSSELEFLPGVLIRQVSMDVYDGFGEWNFEAAVLNGQALPALQEWAKKMGGKLVVNHHQDYLKYNVDSLRYLYDYEDMKLECEECHNLISHKDIELDYQDFGDGEIPIETCPICGNHNTFEQRKYERLSSEILKEIGL